LYQNLGNIATRPQPALHSPTKPLHATRILDLTRLLPGAVSTMLLHDMIAERQD